VAGPVICSHPLPWAARRWATRNLRRQGKRQRGRCGPAVRCDPARAPGQAAEAYAKMKSGKASFRIVLILQSW